MTEQPGRRIPDPGFAGDDGSAPAELTAALTSYAAAPGDPRTHAAVVSALRDSRLLVPVVAVLGESEQDAAGLTHDKSSDMATALLTGQDGRQALLAFTSLATLAAWRADARPVPVTGVDAAGAALGESADALVVDVAGPVSYAVEGELLAGLARGWRLVATAGGYAWAQAQPSEPGQE